MQVLIMQGISGSGKSTLALNLKQEAEDEGRNCWIVSADHFLETRDGGYQFDPKLLPEAHAECLKGFIRALQDWRLDLLIVDNTNTRLEEVAPYYAVAEAYGHDVRIMRVECDVEAAKRRNKHNVPTSTIRRMWWSLNQIEWPARWNVIRF